MGEFLRKITIITPCFNEEASIRNCAAQLKITMEKNLPNYTYEHIFADNSSTDNSQQILRELASSDKNIKVIINSRNVGPFRSIWNAMKNATGDAIIPFLPADLQDPVEVIPKFVEKWEQGYLIAFGIRQNRQESIIMRAIRNFYYRIINRFADSYIPINAGEFLLADKRVISSILENDDYYPYVRGLIAQTAVKSCQIAYQWERRRFGRSKNNLISLIDQAINGFVSTSRVPARLALLSGFCFSVLGIVYAILTFISIIFSRGNISEGIPTIIIGIFLLGGIQLLFLGLIGEYVLSIHGQVRKMPSMFELEKLNFD